jgi:hypothetical protein
MSTTAPVLDPLIAEAKFRMRRRRVFTAVLVLLAGAGVLFLILRPSGPPGTTHVTAHGGNGSGNALAHLNVPVDAAERAWLAGIKSADWGCACGLTPKGVRQVHRAIALAAHESGATIVRIRVFGDVGGTVEVVLATRMNPADYLRQRLPPLVSLLRRGYSYVRVVNGSGARLFEGHWLPRHRAVGTV